MQRLLRQQLDVTRQQRIGGEDQVVILQVGEILAPAWPIQRQYT